jgi:phosphatidylinositol alpha 1,6-mannosyltransferase
VSTSEHCLKAAIALGADPDHSSVVYAGVDLERFNPRVSGEEFRREWNVSEETLVVSVLGHVLRRKLEVLIDAMDRLDSNIPVCYVIGGTGSDLEWVKKRVAAIPERKVVMAGFVAEDKLPEFYAATDALVVSPNTLLECMGQSIKEAMAIGTAVVGPRLGGIVEAIDHGKNGLLYDADDADDLAQALASLALDPALRNRFGSAGRKIAEAKFDARSAAVKTLKVLRDAAHSAEGSLQAQN